MESAKASIDKLDAKITQLCREYEQHFLGLRPREPAPLKGEIRVLIARLSEQPIVNTALRFRLSSLSARFQAMGRRWTETLRRIDEGSYERHQFRAAIHQRGQPASAPRSTAPDGGDLFECYRDARLACGQSMEGLSRQKLFRSLDAQRAKLRERFGADSEFHFRVAVEEGRAKLKAGRLTRETAVATRTESDS